MVLAEWFIKVRHIVGLFSSFPRKRHFYEANDGYRQMSSFYFHFFFLCVSSMFLLISAWAGGLFRGFAGPERSYCRYCTLQYLIWSGSNNQSTACAYVQMTRETPLRLISWTSARDENFRSGSLHLLSSHQQRTTLRTHIGVCQLARTLFTLRCFRPSIGHIPARVSGQCSCWRTRSGLQAAVICLTSD